MTPELKQLMRECRSKTNNLIRSGKLVREPCDYCGDPIVQAHHHDYTQPDQVQWLCRKCHTEFHKLRSNRQVSTICSRCLKPRDRSGRYCRACHAEKMRAHRKTRREAIEREAYNAGYEAGDLGRLRDDSFEEWKGRRR
jgi:ribosomal protein S27AE